jgi:hypothetical protein
MQDSSGTLLQGTGRRDTMRAILPGVKQDEEVSGLNCQ